MGYFFLAKPMQSITFSLHKLDKFSPFFSFSIKYVPHLIFPVDIASSCMVFTFLDFLKWSFTASVLKEMLASLFTPLIFYSAGACLWFYLTRNAYPFPLNMSSTKFQCLHILKVMDQRSTYAGIYFSLAFSLKLFNWFLYILNACTDSYYEFGALQCHYNSFLMTHLFS